MVYMNMYLVPVCNKWYYNQQDPTLLWENAQNATVYTSNKIYHDIIVTPTLICQLWNE